MYSKAAPLPVIATHWWGCSTSPVVDTVACSTEQAGHRLDTA